MRVEHFFGKLKKIIYTKYLYLLLQKKKLLPGLHNLGNQVRCTQNRYTNLQIDLKYPLTTAFHTWPYGRFIDTQSNLKRKKLHRTNRGNFSLRQF